MKLRAIAAVLMALSVTPAFAGPDGSVDLFQIVAGVPDLGSCQGNTLFIPSNFANIQISMQMRLAGATAEGISGVEGFMRVTDAQGLPVDLPGGWAGSIAAASGALSTGDWFMPSDPDGPGPLPLGERGNLVFEGVTGPTPEQNCQLGTDGLVLLATVTYADFFAPTIDFPADSYVTVAPADPPSVPACQGQVIATLCNAPIFTAVCVTGGSFIVNPAGQSCLVAVETQTWSGVKSLYR